MTKPYDTCYIKIETCAAPFPPVEAVRFACGHSARLGIGVEFHCGDLIYGIRPGDEAEDFFPGIRVAGMVFAQKETKR